MNDSKTELIYFGTKDQLAKIGPRSLQVCDILVDPCNIVKSLGAWFDSCFTFEYFVNVKCRVANMNLYKIDDDTCKTLVHALVLSHIDYANGILVGITKKLVSRLQTILNKAAKIVLGLNKYDSATQALFRLHWLPVEYRINFKIATMVYKCLEGTSPEYLSSLLKPIRTGHNTRSESNGLLEIPRASTQGDKAFYVCGPRIWNDLPASVRNSSTCAIFKKRLKTYYFKAAFPTLCAQNNINSFL